ncbi:MAG: 4Fe-4S binding protein [Paludibacteraceae bacterium]|nr:4Fe-4S binding protein [Paludibacteraceae bacterium]
MTKKHKKHQPNLLRGLRILLAALMLTGMILLFTDPTGLMARYASWIAGLQLVPSILACSLSCLGIIVLTLLFGRVYCSVICPLGIMQDLFVWIGRKMHIRSQHYGYHKENKVLRYSILVLFVVLMVIPVTSFIARLLEPYSLFGRIVTAFSLHNLNAAFRVGAIAFILLGIWAQLRGREYCNTICPVGSFLGFISRWTIFRPVIDTDRCVNCGVCGHKCKAQCIDTANHQVDMSRCIGCYDCIGNCKEGAISISHLAHSAESKTDEGRRKCIGILGGLAIAGTVDAQRQKMDGGLAKIEKKQIPVRHHPVRPAGSISEQHFTSHCTACQLCVSACPNQVLRPSTRLSDWLQPELQFDKNYCMITCNRCSEVCPTGAITKISKEDRTEIKIGHAVWIADNCLRVHDDIHCDSCIDHCPTGAVLQIGEDGKHIAVDESRCIGCGKCEYYCPARPFAAIYVEGNE